MISIYLVAYDVDVECGICFQELGLRYALFEECTHIMCTDCATRCLAKRSECPFCRQSVTEYKDMGSLVIVIPDEEEPEENIQEGWSDEEEEEDVLITGYSWTINGENIFVPYVA